MSSNHERESRCEPIGADSQLPNQNMHLPKTGCFLKMPDLLSRFVKVSYFILRQLSVGKIACRLLPFYFIFSGRASIHARSPVVHSFKEQFPFGDAVGVCGGGPSPAVPSARARDGEQLEAGPHAGGGRPCAGSLPSRTRRGFSHVSAPPRRAGARRGRGCLRPGAATRPVYWQRFAVALADVLRAELRALLRQRARSSPPR